MTEDLKKLIRKLVLIAVAGLIGAQAPLSVQGPLSAQAQTATTVDVVKCWALVSLAVTGAYKASAILGALDSLALKAAALDNAASATIGGWLAKIGLVETAGLGKLIVKALELAGIPTAGVLTKATIMAAVNAAKSALNSCSNIVMTFYSSGAAIYTAYTQPTACGSSANHAAWIQCQATCYVSKPATAQRTQYGIPAACNYSPTAGNIDETLRGKYMAGYGKYCFEKYCMMGGTTPPATTSFSQCSLASPHNLFPPGFGPSDNRTDSCNKFKLAMGYL